MFDLISVGDARIDNFIKIDDAHVACTLNKEKCELCFRYGDKIPVSQFLPLTAGNNANNAVGSARLGLKAALFCNIGADPNGTKIINMLKGEGVSTRYVVSNKGMATEVSTVLNFQGERTILVFHQPWVYDLPDLDRTRWLYYSSCSYSFDKNNFPHEIERYVERTGCNLVYTPGTYQLLAGVKKYPKLLSLTHIFIVNKEEAKKILDIPLEKQVEVKELLRKLMDLGPKNVVITDGGDGSYAYDGEKFYKLGVFKAELVEMTGAGDAFATGLVAGLFYGQTLPEAMRWGAANGAAVVEQIGPQAGLLTHAEMQKRLKENAKITAKAF